MNLEDYADHFDTHKGPYVTFYQKISRSGNQLFFDYQMVQVEKIFRKMIFTRNRICSPSFIKIEEQLRKLDFILGSLVIAISKKCLICIPAVMLRNWLAFEWESRFLGVRYVRVELYHMVRDQQIKCLASTKS